MSLSPDDIVGYRFKHALRGYATDEVDELLDQLADQVERTTAEVDELRERVRTAEAQVAAAHEAESTLQRTLVVAQQAAERTVAEAEQTAAEAMRSAEAEAEQVRAEAASQAEATLAEAQTSARREADAARARVEEARTRHLAVLEDVARHRDALRADVGLLDELVAVASSEVAAPQATEPLVGGELPDPSAMDGAKVGEPPPDGPGAQASSQDGGADAGHAMDTLRVRVHGDAAEGPPPLGSTRGGS